MIRFYPILLAILCFGLESGNAQTDGIVPPAPEAAFAPMPEEVTTTPNSPKASPETPVASEFASESQGQEANNLNNTAHPTLPNALPSPSPEPDLSPIDTPSKASPTPEPVLSQTMAIPDPPVPVKTIQVPVIENGKFMGYEDQPLEGERQTTSLPLRQGDTLSVITVPDAEVETTSQKTPPPTVNSPTPAEGNQ